MYHPNYHPLLTRKSADVLGTPKMNKSSITTDDIRPISLTPTLSKILEGFVFKWLAEQIIPYIDPYQLGNVGKCSTTHALIHLIHQWLAATDAYMVPLSGLVWSIFLKRLIE